MRISPTSAHRLTPTHRLTPAHQEGGFTFVELLIVVLLVGLMALVSIVSIRTFMARYQLDTEAQELSTFLNSVPSMARQTNAPVFLVWDGSTSTFVISRDSAGTQVLNDFKIDQKITITPPAATVLRCDVIGRAFVGTSLSMMTASQTMSLQHAVVVNEAMKTFRLSIPPLWAVLVDRV